MIKSATPSLYRLHNLAQIAKEVLQALLGHRSIKTTEIYANWVRKEELERWV